MEDGRIYRFLGRYWWHGFMGLLGLWVVIVLILLLGLGGLVVYGVALGTSVPVSTPTGQCVFPVAVGRAATMFLVTPCTSQYPVPACRVERRTFLGTFREIAPCPERD